MSRGPQGAATRLGSVCLGEQHPLFLGSFRTCGYPGQRWVLGLPPVVPSGAAPACSQPIPACGFRCRGRWGDGSGAAVSGWVLPLRTWERARTRLLSRMFSRSGPPGVKGGLPQADAWLGRAPSGGLCSSVPCFSPHRARPKGASDNL